VARKHKILWSGPAIADLGEIRDYVSHDKPEAAERLARRIRQRVLRLATHPRSGRVVPELAALGYHEVLVSPYRIVYEIQARRVIILRVWHGRRDLV
jgi:toxin ParE1/3/4